MDAGTVVHTITFHVRNKPAVPRLDRICGALTIPFAPEPDHDKTFDGIHLCSARNFSSLARILNDSNDIVRGSRRNRPKCSVSDVTSIVSKCGAQSSENLAL